MKKLYLALLILAVLLVLGAGIYYYLNQVKSTTVTVPSATQSSSFKTATFQTDNLNTDQVVTSPLLITGKAKGWYFEAVFPVKIYDANGKLLGQSQAQAQSDWTSPDFVAFKTTLTFSSPTTSTGYIVFAKDNPSGLAQNADQVTIFIKFH